MAKFRAPNLVPYFGCQPFSASPPPPRTPYVDRHNDATSQTAPEAPRGSRKQERTTRSVKAPCHVCGGRGTAPKGSPFVCVACHAVSPEAETEMGLARAEAARNHEIEQRLIEIAASNLQSARASSLDRGSRVLTLDERQELIDENPDLADMALAWLESIGQPLDGGDLAATVKIPAKPRVAAKTKLKGKRAAKRRGVA